MSIAYKMFWRCKLIWEDSGIYEPYGASTTIITQTLDILNMLWNRQAQKFSETNSKEIET